VHAVAGNARRELESRTGKKVVSNENYLPKAKNNQRAGFLFQTTNNVARVDFNISDIHFQFSLLIVYLQHKHI
jgi:hypothetical protein